MIREPLKTSGVGSTPSFRWRGGEVSRLEGFSDAVFGFALTLLVVSLEVPRTFTEILAALNEFGAFAVCFLLMSMVWYRHYLFFRRYGLEDGYTLSLNAFLLLVVLFYVYPLKFVFTFLVTLLSGREPVVRLADGTQRWMIEIQQVPLLYVIYGLGFTAVFLIFALLYLHAYRQRTALDLNPLEVNDTLESVLSCFVTAGIGLLSIGIAAVSQNVWLPGLVYWLIWITESAIGVKMRRRREQLQAMQVEEAVRG
jgi:uncharacterized membrane protein